MPNSREMAAVKGHNLATCVEEVKMLGFNQQLKVMRCLTFIVWKGLKGAEPTPGWIVLSLEPGRYLINCENTESGLLSQPSIKRRLANNLSYCCWQLFKLIIHPFHTQATESKSPCCMYLVCAKRNGSNSWALHSSWTTKAQRPTDTTKDLRLNGTTSCARRWRFQNSLALHT